MTREPEGAATLTTPRPSSRRHGVAEGVVWCLAVNLAGLVLFLIAADQVLFSSAFLTVNVTLAAISAVMGLWLRRTGRERLGTGVVIGAVAAVPVAFLLSCVWAIVVLTFLM